MIRYTTDGSEPTPSSVSYSSPLVFSDTTTLRVRAFKSGMNESPEAAEVYVVGADDAPIGIDLWYGTNQYSGVPGTPTDYINVLGCITGTSTISTFSYSLNGGVFRELAIGPESFDTYPDGLHRLSNDGDFNADIPVSQLENGENRVVLHAVDAGGNEKIQAIEFQYDETAIWPVDYQIDWSTVGAAEDAVRPIDGKWGIVSNQLRTVEPGYDRMASFGDVNQTNYEVTVSFTPHAMENTVFGGVSTVGLVLNWRGHYNEPGEVEYGEQPYMGWKKAGALVIWETEGDDVVCYIKGYANAELASTTPILKSEFVGATYWLKVQAELTNSGTRCMYRVKTWKDGDPEPSAWTLTALNDDSRSWTSGGVSLLAYYTDVSYSNIQMRSIGPVPDYQAPSMPADLQVTETNATSVSLGWAASTDNVAVAGYRIYRDGSQVGTSGGTTYTDSGLTPQTSYDYAVAAYDAAGNVSATTTPVTVQTREQTLAEWVGVDVGAVAAAGSHSINSGTYTVDGSGADIWGTADEFYYLYQTVDGDADIVVRVASIDLTHGWAKAGVMIRETTDTGSIQASAVITPTSGNGVLHQYRTTTDGTTASSALGDAATPPYWLRLQRVGDLFTAYRSADGATWDVVQSKTISMTTTVLVGMAVCSHADGTLCTASFDSLSIGGDIVGDAPVASPTFNPAGGSYGGAVTVELSCATSGADIY
jgi:regulation of enolase protein 1 (concanavalin A-like superfamily)